MAERYMNLNCKYLKEAREFLTKGDSVQASEKLWGVAAEIVKAIASKRGIELRSHRDLWVFVDRLAEELKDPDIVRLFSIANALHQNFYEDWMPLSVVEKNAEAVIQLNEKLEKLL
ncbi:PaREP1 family protein [Candidatus Bathyarchaeota archaeon]|nr:PaREP1 family protein [Candidatus Bathyarchaeota archaeon]